jgi:predicted phage terminase large subunit-like protein
MARPKTLDVTVPLHRVQQAFRQGEALVRGFVGGVGSGKSWAGSYDLLRRAQPGRLYMATAPTYRMLEDASLRTFLTLARHLHFLRNFGKADMIAQLGNGAEVLFRSTDEPDRLRGPNLSGVWMDEASLSTREAYDILLGRLREQGQQGWLSATFTPKGRTHWTFDVFGRLAPGTALYHATTADNPFLPQGFTEQLRAQYTSAQSEQELEGLFVDLAGALFQRQWFPLVDAAPAGLTLVRRWDFAGSKPKPGRDPDHTAGVLLGRSLAGRYYVLDVRRTRDTAGGVEALVKHTAELDGRAVPIRIEQEPGSAGLFVVDQFVRVVLPGWDCRGVPSTGDKAARARPLAAQAEAGNVYLVRAPWNKELLDELEVFPLGGHDDQVDALSGAFADLVLPLGTVTGSVGARQIDSLPPGTFATPGSFHRMPPGTFRR